MREKIVTLWVKYRQLIVYCLVGGCTTAVNFSLFLLLNDALGVEENLSNTVSVVVSVVFAYVTNKIFVFRTHCASTADLMREALTFFAARGITMLLEVGGGFVLMTLLDLNEALSKLGLTLVILILNFIFSKLFVFKEKEKTL